MKSDGNVDGSEGGGDGGGCQRNDVAGNESRKTMPDTRTPRESGPSSPFQRSRTRF